MIVQRDPGAAGWLERAAAAERAGSTADAFSAYERAVAAAEATGARDLLGDALRRLAVACHHRGDAGRAEELAQRSLGVAAELGDDRRGAQALNALAGFDFESGAMDSAEARYRRAIALGGDDPGIRGRVEQNLGILANIRGDHAGARAHYETALASFERSGDDAGRALALHNLGMVHADLEAWREAAACYRQSLELAEQLGDLHLRGLVLLNHAEVLRVEGRHQEALGSAEQALGLFDQLDSRLDKADAYQAIGRVYRVTGRPQLAEARLKAALDLATAMGSVLSQAEASRELAMVYQTMGRNQEALRLLNTAYQLFGRLDARFDLVDVRGRVGRLEGTFLEVVRGWGESIESADSYTHGHCERVASYALAIGEALGLDDEQLTTLRIGAYLHDLGKVRVPHEILNKPGRLTEAEFGIMRQHPVWGVEMLATVDFPWDIKPIIRWHHEHDDGSGYPDGLRGEEIPLSAQIICVVDVYDALTTTRSYRPAMSHAEALLRMAESRAWWRADVYEAFLGSVKQALRAAA